MAPKYRSPLRNPNFYVRSGTQRRSTNITITDTTSTSGATAPILSSSSPSPSQSPLSLIPEDPTTSPQTHPIPLAKRHQTISIPSAYASLTNSPAPGAVAGIVLGSVAGFIILLYLLSLGVNGNKDTGVVADEEERPGYNNNGFGPFGGGGGGTRRRLGRRGPVVREVIETVGPRDRKKHYHHHHHRRHGHGRGRGYSGGRRVPRETVLVDESVTSPSSRTDDGGDVVEVIESVDGRDYNRERSHSRRRARSRGSY